MTTNEAVIHEEKNGAKVQFGFWLYLMTDCVLFASLFATYAVMHGATAGGPSSRELFDVWFVLIETIILLVSSFTCGLALLAAQGRHMRQVVSWLAVTALLGVSFLGMELYEFAQLAAEGHSWQRSGFLSAFFTLVGTHGLHIATGLLWIGVMIVRIMKRGFTPLTLRKLTMFGMFWHFLDIIWIFIFTIVYMMGAL